MSNVRHSETWAVDHRPTWRTPRLTIYESFLWEFVYGIQSWTRSSTGLHHESPQKTARAPRIAYCSPTCTPLTASAPYLAKRKMMCWGGVRPRPRPRLPPLEGGGGQPRNGLLVVLPPVRKSPVSRAAAGRVRCARRHAAAAVAAVAAIAAAAAAVAAAAAAVAAAAAAAIIGFIGFTGGCVASGHSGIYRIRWALEP